MQTAVGELEHQQLEHLVNKYSVAGPRYTSYPTAVELRTTFDRNKWREALVQDVTSSTHAGHKPSYSLYIHLPFCHSLCYYCACNKVIALKRAGVEPYLRALFAEMAAYQNALGSDVPIEQIHWGGGTPNYLIPSEMEQLHRRTLLAFPNLLADADVAIEVDPRTSDDTQLESLSRLGFNRISIGVQDFDPHVQELINRVQPFEMTREVCTSARQRGFKSINVDLIYGLPDQTLESFSETTKKIIELKPERIALYGYAHVTWIKKAQKSFERAHLPTPLERIQIFLRAAELLTQAGYVQIGMDHFALPHDQMAIAHREGVLNRNFMGYSTHGGTRVIGLGVSSISSLPGAMAQNAKSLEDYQDRATEHGIATERGLLRSEDDQMRSDIIEQLMCNGELRFSEIEARWGVSFQDEFSDSLEQLDTMAADKMLTISSQQITLTPLGRLFVRNAAMPFDAYLEQHRETKRQVFSQAV